MRSVDPDRDDGRPDPIDVDQDLASPSVDRPLRRLGDVMVAQGALTADQLLDALELRRSAPLHRRRLGQVIVDHRLASERDVALALGELFSLPVVDLAAEPLSVENGRLLPKAVARRNGLLVLDRSADGVLRVASADPKNVLALDDLRLHTGATKIEVVIATETDLRDHLERVWSMSRDSEEVSVTLGEVADDSAEEDLDSDPSLDAELAPIVRLVSSVLSDAVRSGASDIHIEPLRRGLRVRMRIDGLLRETLLVPHGSRAAFISRLKIVSGLDISERRRPQDGRTRIALGDVTVDARVSTLPSLHGETVVVRLLSRAENTQQLDELGLDEDQLAAIRRALRRPQGLILLTGPTGSGKTSSLFSALTEIHDVSRNIVTLEDPIEIQLPGLTQVQINERTGLTFAAGLRSVLRQDPDVVLVGEVRDTETAELALRASLTGHLVLTTVHTNDAVSALTRFVDMGVAPYLVASSLTLVIAQRLVRAPCPTCSLPSEPTDETLAMLGLERDELPARAATDGGAALAEGSDASDGTGTGTAGTAGTAGPRQGSGCRACGETGYLGRRAVFEVLEVTPEIRRTLLADPDESALGAAARAQAMTTLRQHALALAHRGGTTYAEVLRVTDRA